MHAIAIVAVLFLSSGVSRAQNATPSYTCNLAKANAPGAPKASVLLRTGPGRTFKQVGKLAPQQQVYICDERGDWYEVYYSDAKGPCGVPVLPNGMPVEAARKCHSAWAEKRLIEVISG